MNFIQLRPIYQERVWGGRRLAEALGRHLPGTGPIGESWEIVDRSEADSPVILAPGFSGTTLGELRRNQTADLMGPGWSADRPFPILVKWLDCRERLSLQVHPPLSVAAQLGGEPKTENWFIADCEDGAALLAGVRPGVDRQVFEQAIAAGTVEDLVYRLPVRPGDSLFVPSGRLHAIDAGNLILEIQQNSDTTYRVFDWGRVGLDGRPRQLHVQQSLDSIVFSDTRPEILHPSTAESVLADAPEFRLRHFRLKDQASLDFPAGEQPRILSVVAGQLLETSSFRLQSGDSVILPYAGASSWIAEGEAIVLLTDRFNV